MARKWKTRAERKKIYDEVLQKAERSKAKVRAVHIRPQTSERPKVQAKKPDFRKMEPITEMPKKTAQDTKNNYAMSLLRASEISDSARFQNAFGGKAERETLDLTASEAWNRTVVEASEPAEFSTEQGTDSVLKDEIRRIEGEAYFKATGNPINADQTVKKKKWIQRTEKTLLGILFVFDIVAWIGIMPTLIDRIIDSDREDMIVVPKKDPDVSLISGRESTSDIGTKMLERR